MSALDQNLRLSPKLWENGWRPSMEQYRALLRRGVMLYNLDMDSKFDNYYLEAVRPEQIAERYGNLLYVTALGGYNRQKTEGFKGCARNERLLPYLADEAAYMDAAHQEGIPVLVYQNENNFDSEEFSGEERAAMMAELTPFAWAFSNPGRMFACYNKPGWIDFLVERLALRVGKTGADGVFMDNNTPFLHCRCEHCKRLYRETFGEDADLEADMGGFPETVVADMRVFDYVGTSQVPKDLVPVASREVMRYLEWRIERIAAFHRTVRARLEEKIGRRVLYTANGHVGIAEQSAVQLSGALDMIFSEDGFTAPPVSNAFNLHLGSAMSDYQNAPFIITRVVEGVPNRDMVRGLNAECRALGGQGEFWDKNYQQEPQLAAAQKQYRTFFVNHADDLYRAEREGNDIAVVYSWRSDLWTSQSVSPAKKWGALLEDLNLPYDVLIAEKENHARLLSRYSLVILPVAEILSDAWFSVLEGYLASGGRVITTGNTAAYDERIEPRKRALSGGGLLRMEGVPEYDYYKTRRIPSMHNGYRRPQNAMTEAVEELLPAPAVTLSPSVELVTLNHTLLPDGEAVHLVNRLMNINPITSAADRRELRLVFRPARPVARIDWLSPDGEEQSLPSEEKDGTIALSLPALHVYGIVRAFYQEKG